VSSRHLPLHSRPLWSVLYICIHKLNRESYLKTTVLYVCWEWKRVHKLLELELGLLSGREVVVLYRHWFWIKTWLLPTWTLQPVSASDSPAMELMVDSTAAVVRSKLSCFDSSY
jgi:hypothetical protein